MGRGASHPDPMSDLVNFDADIRTMHKRAHQDGNLDWLRLSLDSLIVNPDARIGTFAGQSYPFNDADLVAIFSHAFRSIWPDRSLSEPGDQLDLEFETVRPIE